MVVHGYHVTNRQPTLEAAIASARRLNAKFGQERWAVVRDEMGIPGFTHPFAVVTYTNPYA